MFLLLEGMEKMLAVSLADMEFLLFCFVAETCYLVIST